MNKLTALALLAVIAAISLILGALFAPILGATEKQCIGYIGNEIITLQQTNNTTEYDYNELGCAWLADKIVSNGSGFNVLDVRIPDGNGYEAWVLVK